MPIDNLNANELEALVRRIERLERATPVGFSSVSRGALRITSPEGLIVEGSEKVTGTLSVTGTENVTGTLNVSGALNVSGPESITGPLTVSGTASITGASTTITSPLHINGATDVTGALTAKGTTRLEGDTTQVGALHVTGNQDITGTLGIKGVTTLEKDLKVIAGGIIRVGDGMTLEPLGAGSGAINFQPKGSISAGMGGSILMISPDLLASVSIGAGSIDVGGTIKATLTKDTNAAHVANVYYDPATRTLFYK